MTLSEFEELATTILCLAAPDHDIDQLSEAARCTLLIQLLKKHRIASPSEMAAYREHTQTQQEVLDAVKMAAATGKLHTVLHGAEPS